MPDFDFDLFVIGAGSGGVRTSRLSASFGARVAVAEDRPLGGTCVNVGCIPKKLLVYASHYAEDFEDAALGYGWTVGERAFDWSSLIEKKNQEIARLNGVYAQLLDAAGVRRIEGRATLEDAHTVRVGDARYTARTILVATGGWPSLPEIPGVEHGITSNECFTLKELPRRVVIVGGGYIAVEFAGIFNGTGSDVVQLYRGAQFLRGFDDDLRTSLCDEMRKKGVELRFNVNVESVEKIDSGVRAILTDGSSLEADQILFATGRAPNTSGLGLQQAGVELGPKGEVVVDEYSRSSVESIYAIGDVTDRIALTPVAIHEAICLADTLFNDNPRSPDHEDVPSAVFSQPAIGTVGLTEAQARQRFERVDVYTSKFRPLKHTLTGRNELTFMKLLVDRATDRVVGVHMLGPDAAEVIQGFGVALKCNATKAQFDATIGIHPTSAEELVTMREPLPEDS
ncbi:MAG: glutathione-disulfide reductase [Proteobacteria bacterium]|nr:glutathione-disulfide reductase [Pseudomonadota bacterium]